MSLSIPAREFIGTIRFSAEDITAKPSAFMDVLEREVKALRWDMLAPIARKYRRQRTLFGKIYRALHLPRNYGWPWRYFQPYMTHLVVRVHPWNKTFTN